MYGYYRHNTSQGVLAFQFSPQESTPSLKFLQVYSPNKAIKRKGFRFYLTDKEEGANTEYHPVVDYKNGVLVIDAPPAGRLNDLANSRRLRQVWLAIPKKLKLGATATTPVTSEKPVVAFIDTKTPTEIPYREEEVLSSNSAQKLKAFVDANRYRVIDEQTLKNMPVNTNYPADIDKILQENDLMEICSYSWEPKDHFYRVAHFSAQNMLKRFSDTHDMYFRFANFDGEPPRLEFIRGMRSSYHIKKVGKYTFMVGKAFYEKEEGYGLIVDCKNGVLIIEDTPTGKVDDLSNPIRWRRAYLIIPRFF
jgi:hypothetical protein